MPSFRRPSAAGKSPGAQDRCGQGSESFQNGLATYSVLAITELPDRYGRTTETRSQPPLPHHVARSDGTDQAFPEKKLGCCGRKLCRTDHGMAFSIVTITWGNRGHSVVTS